MAKNKMRYFTIELDFTDLPKKLNELSDDGCEIFNVLLLDRSDNADAVIIYKKCEK